MAGRHERHKEASTSRMPRNPRIFEIWRDDGISPREAAGAGLSHLTWKRPAERAAMASIGLFSHIGIA